jgi:hypothetical protein
MLDLSPVKLRVKPDCPTVMVLTYVVYIDSRREYRLFSILAMLTRLTGKKVWRQEPQII